MRRAGGAETTEVAVIGAGVIGCAIARRFALEGVDTLVLEKADDILDGASKGNSGILHTGFDAPPGSLEQACVAAGHAEYLEIRERLGLPLLECGALVIAWTEADEAALPALIAQAEANGVAVERLDGRGLRALEPALAPTARAGFRVAGEHVIDPWSAPLAYLLQALANGARVRRGAAVAGGVFDGRRWRLDTTAGPVEAGAVINAAGLWGDEVERRLTGSARLAIRPRKGQFIVFDKPAAALARHILLPVPGPTTKGVVVCRTAFGNLLVGPTAEEQESREVAALDRATLAALRRRGEAILPALAAHDVVAAYAGLRPATERKEYRVEADPARRYILAGGIRSTGLTSALGAARHVFALWRAFGDAPRPPPDPAWPRVPAIAEDGPRAWLGPAPGPIVCHCERVTRAEIAAALTGPLGARTMGGLKRRTRATMGRCQGFYCMAAVSRMLADARAAAGAAADAPASPAAADA